MGCCLVVIRYISYAVGGGYFIMGSTCCASNARHFADGVALPCMNNMIASLKDGEAKMLKKVYKPEDSMQSPILLSKGSIFGPFVIFGLSGFLWVLVWLSAISCAPDRSSQISEYELEYILNKEWKSFPMENKSKTRRIIPPFMRLLSKMPTWSLIVANTIHSWSLLPVSRFSSTEDEHHHLLIYHADLKHAPWFSAVPWRVMGFMGYFGGILNTAGTLTAIVGTVGAGFFVELVGSFRGILMLTLLLYFLAALFYNIFSTGE
ncbi:PREDICTED: probable anion transporter 4, chloroplastic [Populus euphratica]|uniref:Probable anion transporter 4, chloroplastic n=1 Tax=Populus euphratica TaxID=75702 RepID=A0AAJ6XV06_POPEU|nr:PREDICTED: probable anion transporter 4, chloroplastic [Populus euphratica]